MSSLDGSTSSRRSECGVGAGSRFPPCGADRTGDCEHSAADAGENADTQRKPRGFRGGRGNARAGKCIYCDNLRSMGYIGVEKPKEAPDWLFLVDVLDWLLLCRDVSCWRFRLKVLVWVRIRFRSFDSDFSSTKFVFPGEDVSLDTTEGLRTE
ncbi:hypothetical protein ZIOFF_064477 [Zingiber officinale]|uniref:Uncharacterized protein n=1 Tax=Zingiber officinale TaxID=94328 RepID=A0A8J5K6Q3_ZINOF|nr:hypothetical protein ZIOFF_064477 [Zingiber officinale]